MRTRDYYNEDDYRFEVSGDTFDEVRELLEEQFYEPVIIRDLKSFCVVYPKYTEHPSLPFKASVLQRSKGSHHLFLIKDQLSVSYPCLIHLVRYSQRPVHRVELLHSSTSRSPPTPVVIV